GCGQGAPRLAGKVAATRPAAASARSSPATPPTPTPAPSPSAWPLVLPVPVVRAGLHQTGKRPPADSLVFQAEMTDLWAAVITGRPKLALPAFFPLVAYEQVKAIADPAADWHE